MTTVLGHVNYNIKIADLTFSIDNCHTNIMNNTILEISSDNIKNLSLIAYYYRQYKNITITNIGQSDSSNKYEYTLYIRGINLDEITKTVI